jgi:oligoribonuclease
MAAEATGSLVWMDMEMSGLDPKTCVILEIATLITDKDLVPIAQGPSLVIHHPDPVLDAMDAWNKEHHAKSGLIAAVKASSLTLAEAEQRTLDFIAAHCAPKSSPLCGNTIYQDRRFLIEYMPKLESYLHYRLVDVSTVKELVKRWYGPEFQAPDKRQKHMALEDILETVEELRFYREKVFKAP